MPYFPLFCRVLSGLIVAFSVCTASAQVLPITPATYTGRQVVVGSGGGFSGFTTTYYLLDNGRLFRRADPDTVAVFVKKLPRTTTQQLFSRLETRYRIKTTKYNHPGNMYQFVGWQRGKQKYRVTWSEPDAKAPASYPVFYKQFMLLVPSQTKPQP